MAKKSGVERFFAPAFMEGGDPLPTGGPGYIQQLQQKMRDFGGAIASVNGRYYAMDRDRRWPREEKAFAAMVEGRGEGGSYTDPVEGIKNSYNQGVTDEFVVPFVVTDQRGQPVATIRDDDACICFNFRADRVRQIARVLARESGITPQGGRELPDAETLDQTIPRSRIPHNL